jgi:hypothetical protein
MTRSSFVPSLSLALVAVGLSACSGSRSLVTPPPTNLAVAPTSYPTVVAPSPCAPPPCTPPPCAAPASEPIADLMARPPDAAEGEVWCYIRVPAVTQTISEQVMVSPPSCREEWVPPVTQEVTEQVCVKPEERRRVPVAPVFEERVEQILVCDAKTEWRKVDCMPKALGQGEQVGECWTLVTIPAQYQPRTTRICIQPETFREEVIAAEFAPRTRTVTVTEGHMKKVEVPAVFDVRTREVEVSPARWEWRRTSECELPALGQPAEAPVADVPVPVPAPVPVPEVPAAPAIEVPAAAAGPQPAIPDAPAFDAPPSGELPPVPVPAETPASK